jgi:ABC-type bacteriocin/lantibiotic exporter with double-glycine peptidase domain
VALVGPSGGGKSTILRMLLGFETPASGSVTYDGRPIQTLDMVKLRRQIGVVLQDGRLFSGSLYENVCGAVQVAEDDVWDAVRRAGLEPDVAAMPMGLHTVLTEGAVALSGGQKQRLLIARALVHRPKLLLFDEATSALDNRTQAVVAEALAELPVTRIAIAHRLSTVRDADRILVIDRGEVVQQGSYETLVAEPGLFADLAHRQLV